MPQTPAACLGRGLHRGWFAHPEHAQPGQEQGPEGHQHERRGAAHALEEHPTHDQHEDGQYAGDEAKGRIGLTALCRWKEIAQPGQQRRYEEGTAEIGHENGHQDPGQGGRQGERQQPGHRQRDADQDPRFAASPARPGLIAPHACPGMHTDIEEVVPGHNEKGETRRESKPHERRMQTGVVVPQRMARLEQDRDKRVKHQPGQGGGIGDQAKEHGAPPAEGLHRSSFTPSSCA